MTDIEKDTAVEGVLVDPIDAARSDRGWLDLEELEVPGWDEVLIKSSGGYSWDFFGAWYDTTERIFYWHSDSGCSCNGPGDSVYSVGDLEQGRKTELIAAYRTWAAEEFNEAITNEERVSAEHDMRQAIRGAVGA